MTRLFILLLAVSFVATTGLTASAAEKLQQTYEPSCGSDDSANCDVNPCDCCRAKMKVGKHATRVLDPDYYTCCPEMKQEKVEKYCYNVCAEPVCVPAFRWPWECCCTPPCKKTRCGKVRAVNVLEKAAYECDACATEWKVKRKRCCGCSQCASGGSCCAATEQTTGVRTAAAESPARVSRTKTEPRQESLLAKFGEWLLR